MSFIPKSSQCLYQYDMTPIEEYESIFGPIGYHELSYVYFQVKDVLKWTTQEIRNLFEELRDECIKEMREYDNHHDIRRADMYLNSLEDILELIDITEHEEFLNKEKSND